MDILETKAGSVSTSPPASENPPPLVRELARMSGPLFVGLLLFASTTVVDAYFLGRLGTDALIGFGFGLPLWILVQSLVVGFVSGLTAVVSRTLGAHGERRALAHLKDGALSAAVLGVILGVSLYLGRHAFYRLIGADAAQAKLADEYFLPFAYSLPTVLIGHTVMAFQRGMGSVTSTAVVAALGSVLNIVFCPIFIFGSLDIVPPMGLRGAALATVLSFNLAIPFCLLSTWKDWKNGAGRSPQAAREDLWAIAVSGTPLMLTEALDPLIVAVMTALVAPYGAAAVAALAILSRVAVPLKMLPMAVGLSTVQLVGVAWGARDWARAHAAVALAGWSALVWGAAQWLLVLWAGAGTLAEQFSGDREVAARIVEMCPWWAASIPVASFCIACIPAFAGAERAIRSTQVTVVAGLVLQPLLARIGASLWGLPGVFMGAFLANLVSAVVVTLLLYKDGILLTRRKAAARWSKT